MIFLLIDTAIRSTLLALAAGSILSLCRVRDAGIRLAAWTVVLYGVLLLPFLGTVLPPVAIPVIAPAQVSSVKAFPMAIHGHGAAVRVASIPQSPSVNWGRIADYG